MMRYLLLLLLLFFVVAILGGVATAAPQVPTPIYFQHLPLVVKGPDLGSGPARPSCPTNCHYATDEKAAEIVGP